MASPLSVCRAGRHAQTDVTTDRHAPTGAQTHKTLCVRRLHETFTSAEQHVTVSCRITVDYRHSPL